LPRVVTQRYAPVTRLGVGVGSVGGFDGNATVVEGRRLGDDTERSDEPDGREQPEHETIKHVRHELPVLLHLHITATRPSLASQVIVRPLSTVECTSV